MAELSGSEQYNGLQHLKYLLSGPLEKKVAEPRSNGGHIGTAFLITHPT